MEILLGVKENASLLARSHMRMADSLKGLSLNCARNPTALLRLFQRGTGILGGISGISTALSHPKKELGLGDGGKGCMGVSESMTADKWDH